jgi:hypothetical protein
VNDQHIAYYKIICTFLYICFTFTHVIIFGQFLTVAGLDLVLGFGVVGGDKNK